VGYELDRSGGGVCSRVNKRLLEDRFAGGVEYIEFDRRQSLSVKLWRTAGGYLLGLDRAIARHIMERIEAAAPGYVFLNFSQLGRLACRIKRKFPEVTVITFFHDIEALFCWRAVKELGRPQNLLTLAATYYNERLAVKFSDKTICLNEREARDMQRVYGCRSDLLLPIALQDRFDPERAELAATDTSRVATAGKERRRPKGIFVGSLFYPNYAGIKWFYANVVPYIAADIEVVGLDFEKVGREFDRLPNFRITGTVDDVDAYYYDADFVVAPVFTGGGMKVKTAEALMFGKTIFGTPEAFVGYDVDFDRAGGLCRTAGEFIEKINSFSNGKFNPYSRELFLKKYSYETARAAFTKFLTP